MNESLISIITPVFNGAAMIESCIQNVIAQQCPQAEHVIVDGGSTDGTVGVIERYASQYPHIRWVSEKDRGQSDAMNKGIRMARAPVISFLNVDDYYEPNVFSRIIKRFESLLEPTLLIGNCNIWRDGEFFRVSVPHRLTIVDLLLNKGEFPHNPTSYFYHKSLHQRIGYYNEEEHFNLDVEFLFDAIQHAHVVYVNEIWGNFYMLPGTKTRDLLVSGQHKPQFKAFIARYVQKQSWHIRMAYSLRKSATSFVKKISSYRTTAFVVGKKMWVLLLNRG